MNSPNQVPQRIPPFNPERGGRFFGVLNNKMNAGLLLVLLCFASSQVEAGQAPPVNIPQEAPGDAKPLAPAESMKQFLVDEDLELEQILAEPIVTQPVFLNFDERGRMWVVQYRQYPWPAGLKMVSRDSVYRVVYDKIP